MKWFLYGFGILYIAFGGWTILYTETVRRLISQITAGKYIKALAVLAGAFGVLLMLAAPHSRHSWFVVVLGILGVVKCLLFLFGPQKFTTELIRWYTNASDQTWRLWGIIALVLGTAITSWII